VPYAAGLAGFCLVKVLAPGFFARQDTRTPVRIGLIALATSMSFNLLVVVPWAWFGGPVPHAGLAAGTALGAFVNTALLYRALRRDGVLTAGTRLPRYVLQVAVAAGVMGVLLARFTPPLPLWLEASVIERCGWLALAITGGVVSYAGALLASGLRPADLGLTPRSGPV
jgi:putative peptidoglycan lipid II flippase